ncbi:unnamed protein product [Nippostrongylus brasiliensis]|uniref:Dimer_Tnp_hAT domain-containing protein n=1 Tax=Nippostrongylus brasiliensis TaxID=27835 RepID=A0A0N4YN17_NIPBR|nr:unnamed protein product [Nippostrongylus brasiliensis]
MTFVAVLLFMACCSARQAVVCYRNGAKREEVADLKELCEAEFTVPLCPTNKLLDAASTPSFADDISSIKSIVNEMMNIITPHIFELLCIAYIGTRWGANALALLNSDKASKESNEKFTEEKLRNGELLLEKEGLTGALKKIGKNVEERRSNEATEDFPYALDRHIILDVTECGGGFEHFHNYVLNGTSRESRGYPAYIDEDGVVDKTARKALIINSVESIKKYCDLPSANYEFTRLYNDIGENVRRLRSWPPDLRNDRYSLGLYQTLLDNPNQLMLEDPIIEGIRCFLVIPASIADPERSFSTANRLSRGEANLVRRHWIIS